jgi:hypothetical protein
MSLRSRLTIVLSFVLCLAGTSGAAVVTHGTLYGLVFDPVEGLERVVTVDQATGTYTPVGTPVADCCTVGGFPISALDSDAGILYGVGNLLSDPGGTPKRLLGFDVVTGLLVSSPFLEAGYQYNLIELDVETGTLYGLAFDLGVSLEVVVTVDAATGAVTPIAGGIADCCFLGGFPVLAVDSDAGVLYAAGNLLSDDVVADPMRLLGFDLATGTLVSSPFLPGGGGLNYNLITLDRETGTLYGLVFDFGTSEEMVVTVDPATAALTPVGPGIADCCTIGGFQVHALDPDTGMLYAAGNLFSDPPGPKRLLAFDVVTGTLAPSPFLPAGFPYLFELAIVPAPNQPPVAVCQDAVVDAAPGLCTAGASIDGGSFDPEGGPLTLSQDPPGPYPVGATLVTLTVEDGDGATDTCQGTVTVADAAAPVVSCDSPPTITPPDAPLSFTATATDDCSDPTVEVLGYDCWKHTRKGRRVDKTSSCVVTLDGATVTIHDSGGVGDHISWEVRAVDGGGNEITMTCELEVVQP